MSDNQATAKLKVLELKVKNIKKIKTGIKAGLGGQAPRKQNAGGPIKTGDQCICYPATDDCICY